MSRHNLLYELQNADLPKASATAVKLLKTQDGLHLFGYGTTVPTAGAAGWISGALFMDTDAAGGTDTTPVILVNDGSGDSCSFIALNVF